MFYIIKANSVVIANNAADVTTAVALSRAAANNISALAVPQAMLLRAELIAESALLYCGMLVCVERSQVSYCKLKFKVTLSGELYESLIKDFSRHFGR